MVWVWVKVEAGKPLGLYNCSCVGREPTAPVTHMRKVKLFVCWLPCECELSINPLAEHVAMLSPPPHPPCLAVSCCVGSCWQCPIY
jgi:hypothetical protein